ncbi:MULTISPECIES: ATP phosphoribosyltransferase [Marinobacter]|jgi:ATP phosphoribosyltransferase|uniref:ATP phosphoribosyltransferase n=1 Tax=Marinobacter segnicrescens TaxID=430453 RepID=A0A1I0AXM8_9GAMM|nr:MULTISPECIES: ATP phosphoribosyltransferase [Marinobacter]UZD67028.1 ATP phosphoribosyltransferase [Marinobacter sp. AN1]SES98377.1 ATP phosphoribosyltransferase [Marinobacter segnicrescens]
MTETSITIALSKGRILDETIPLLREAGIEFVDDISKSRKLVFPSTDPNVRLLIIRATDVPAYVQYGGADLGVTGKDVLMEHGGEGLYEPLDLNISRCRLMTAGVKGQPAPQGRLRVATKFVNLARRYYAAQGRQADIIKLYGAMELAPILGLADEIVDIVDTGNTLKANGLEARDLIENISTRLIANRASMKMKHALLQPIIEKMGQAVEARRAVEA